MERDAKGKDVMEWVQNHLFQKMDGSTYYFPNDLATRCSLVGVETVLYSTRLGGGFLATLVNGEAHAAAFKYHKLLEALFAVTNREPCHWLYVTDPDNCLSCLEYHKPVRFDETYLTSCILDIFEAQSAPQGRNCYLLLIGNSKKWILQHEWNPGNDFTISLHGPAEMGEPLMSKLGISAAEDCR